MAKQIYIDSNGNEVLVSGTITDAGNLPLGSDFTDPTSTAGAVKALQDSINPNAYSTTGLSYPTGVSLVCGGYYKAGKICIVNMRLTLSSSISGTLVQGLPLPLDISNNMVAVTNNKLIDIGLLNDGKINAGSATSGTVILAVVYLCQ